MNNVNVTTHPMWATHLSQAFGDAGVVATAFYLGSLFADEIREEHRSYPLMEITGDAGAGKSSLITFLNMLCGRENYEGFAIRHASPAARNHHYKQTENRPLVLLDSDHLCQQEANPFDWDELKTAFTGHPIRSMAVRSNPEPDTQLRGAVVISRYNPLNCSEAMLSHLVHIRLNRNEHTSDSTKSAIWLERAPMQEVATFVTTVEENKARLLKRFNEQAESYESTLLDLDIFSSTRSAKNHGQLMALVDCLGVNGLNLLPHTNVQTAKCFVLGMAVAQNKRLGLFVE